MNNGLRIALLTPTFLPNTGGVQVGLHNIALHLQEKGHHPVIVTASHYQRQLTEMGWQLPYPIEGLPRKLWKLLHKHPRTIFFIMDRLLRRLHKHYRFDCWHATLAYPTGICLTHYAQSYRAPHLIRSAGDDIQKSPEIGYGLRLNPAIDDLVSHWLPRADCVTAITQTVADEYRALNIDEDKIHFIPNGVDLERFERHVDRKEVRRRYEIPENDFLFISVGRHHPKKDFETLVRAFAHYQGQEAPDAGLVIVGLGSSKLRPLAEDLGVSDKTFLFENIGIQKGAERIPQVPGDDLIDLYRSADCFVFPSLMETFGIVIVEAMAAGLPVLTTDAPGCRDIIEKGRFGTMLPTGDSEAFAAAMRDIALNREERELLVGRSKRRSRDFSWDAVVDRYIELYRELIDRSAG